MAFAIPASTSCCSPPAIHGPNPRDNLPEVVIRFDDLAKRRHRPDYSLGAFSLVAQVPESIAGTELTCAKRDQPEQCVVVITVQPSASQEACFITANPQSVSITVP